MTSATPAGYHSEAAFDAAVAKVGADQEGVSHAVIGRSVQGRDIVAVTFSSTVSAAERPSVVILAGIHGIEVISTELALRLLEDLIAPETSGAGPVLAGADVTVVPCLNPDGRAAALRSLGERGLFRRAPRRNANGVDLNRNWPWPEGARDHWLPLAGTQLRRTPWYRGPRPLSEPETAAFAGLLDERRPIAMLNLHSTGQILTYPWSCRPEPPEDVEVFEAMAQAFREGQCHHRYRSKQSRAWYPIVGSSNDFVYDRYRTLAMTVEISPSAQEPRRRPGLAKWAFWFANPVDVARHLDNDAPGCWRALAVALEARAD